MKIGLLIDETFFFHPKYVSDLCLKYNKDIKVAFLVTKIKKKILFKNIFTEISTG